MTDKFQKELRGNATLDLILMLRIEAAVWHYCNDPWIGIVAGLAFFFTNTNIRRCWHERK